MKNQASCQHNYNIDHPMSHKEKIEGEVMEKENQKPGYELPETFVGVN